MAETRSYLYGPVYSRRLGRSLGVDVMPLKVCTLDCIYCQLGRTGQKTLERKEYAPVGPILAEIVEELNSGLEADFVTIGGSGEPTLNSGLGRLIEGIKSVTSIPVAVLTNGTLLYRQDVRADCARADVVLPSLDAGDEETFRRINRPHNDISIEKLITGLVAFRDEFKGEIWLEVFLVDGINTDDDHLSMIAALTERVRPDKIHLNTAVRPTAEAGVRRPNPERLRIIAERLGPKCEVIAESAPARQVTLPGTGSGDVFSMLKRRPCTLDDICSGLGIRHADALEVIRRLERQGAVQSVQKYGKTFFQAT